MLIKQRKTVYLLLLFLKAHLLISQIIPTGVRTDFMGQDFDDYYSSFTHPIKDQLEIRLENEFEAGKYCDTNGSIFNGNIKLDDNKIYYKKDKNNKSKEKIKAENLKYIIIGIDSFISTNNFIKYHKQSKTPKLIQILGKGNGFVFGRYFKITKKKVEQFYLVRKDLTNTTWINLSNGVSFEEKIIEYFGHIPTIKQSLSHKEIKKVDIPNIIQKAIYLEKYQEKLPEFYNKYWQELPLSTNESNKAFVTNVKDSIFTLDYYSNSIKKLQISYSSFYPKRKNGWCTFYGNNKNTIKRVFYENNKAKHVIIFNDKESIIKEYTYKKGDASIYKKHGSVRYKSGSKLHTNKEDFVQKKHSILLDESNQNLVNKKGNYTFSSSDPIDKKTYYEEYANHIKSKTFRITDQDTIFQLNAINSIGSNISQEKLSKLKEDFNFENAFIDNAQGTLLLSVTINPKGHLEDYYLLNKIHPEIDNFVLSVLEKKYSKKAKFNKLKKLGYYETIVLIHFYYNRFYRQPPVNTHNLYFDDFMFQQNMLMQQQQQMNNSIRNLQNMGRAGF